MIVNVINSGITESASNVFAGMSLAEACGQLQANVSDALNEMNMSILLNEHLYLRENGEDISYVNEGKLADLKNKITGAVDKVISQVSQLWDKLVSWVQDRVEDVRMAFARAKVNKDKAQKACAAGFEFPTGLTIKNVKDEDIEKIIAKIDDTDYDSPDKEKSEFKLDTYITPMTSATNSELNDAFQNVFNTEHTTIGRIRTAKKTSIEALNALKKEVKGSDDSDKSEQVKKINKQCRNISAYSSLAIKAYHTNIDASVKLLQTAVRTNSALNKISKNNEKLEKKSEKFAQKYSKTSESAIFTDDRFFKA